MKKLLPLCTLALALAACTPQETQQQQSDPATAPETTPAPDCSAEIKEHNDAPMVFDAEQFALQNPNYRTSLWTGELSQMTLMSIPAGEDIGPERHDDVEQYLFVCSGKGTAMMGPAEDDLSLVKEVGPGDCIIIPLHTWHNVVNASETEPLKVVSIYAPAEHPAGTVQATRAEALAAEEAEH